MFGRYENLNGVVVKMTLHEQNSNSDDNFFSGQKNADTWATLSPQTSLQPLLFEIPHWKDFSQVS